MSYLQTTSFLHRFITTAVYVCVILFQIVTVSASTFAPTLDELRRLPKAFSTGNLDLSQLPRRTEQGKTYVEVDDMRFLVRGDVGINNAANGNLWNNGVVYYVFDPAVSISNRQAWRDAAATWSAVAALTFIEATGSGNYIYVQNSSANNSFVGMIGGAQAMNISNWGYKYIIAHEIGHALGLIHEQSRSDRDSYVTILSGNIQSGQQSNFNVQPSTNYGLYDFDSVMHYDKCAFSTDCPLGSSCACTNNTIVVLPPNNAQWQNNIGQRDHLSQLDQSGMAQRYGGGGALTASVIGNSRSIFMDPFSGFIPGLGQVYNYVTTYDGQSGVSLYPPASGELRPRSGQPGTYEADYVTFDAQGFFQDWGSFTGNLPTTDSDGNGLPDVVQKNKSGNASVSGTAVSDFGTVSNITGSLQRPANSGTGSYSVTLTRPGSSVTYSGALYLLTVSGTINYSRTTGVMSLNVVEPVPHGSNRTLSGWTYFNAVNINQVTLQQFNVSSSDGYTYTVLPTTLNRSGNKYTGNVQLVDGSPETYWMDYANWVFEITDGNDSDGDGIPDLSDQVQPPSVQTLAATSVGSTSTIINGTVTNDWGVPIEGRYFYYWIDPNFPSSVDDSRITVSGNNFSAQLTGLTPNATYHYQAYALNGSTVDVGAGPGWGFGAVASFTPRLSQLGNISTRLGVGIGDNVLIGGFIIKGMQPKKTIVRALGPTLTGAGLTGVLADPMLELHNSGGTVIASNDNWHTTQLGGIITANQVTDIQNSGLAPSQNAEAAIIATLQPGNYTAIVRGKNSTTGIAIIESYDLDQTVDSKLANISTRGLVQTGDNVMIGGLIIKGFDPAKIIVRAIGPSLAGAGISNPLQDPTLELHDGNGTLITFNDNWKDSQQADIQTTGLAPSSDAESAILATLSPGSYTAIVRGKNDTSGVALIEAYQLGN